MNTNIPVVTSMVAKNPALFRLIEIFDYEVMRTEKIGLQPSRMLSGNELMRQAAGLPDYNSFFETELYRMFKIGLYHIRFLSHHHLVYFIQLTGGGCTPF